MLFQRELNNMKRDIGALIGRFGVTIFLNLLFGLIFMDTGRCICVYVCVSMYKCVFVYVCVSMYKCVFVYVC